MTAYFVLDENVIVLAAKVKDASGRLDNTCAQLLGDILRKKDVIRVNIELSEKYQEKLNELEKPVRSAAHTVKLLKLLRASGQINYWDNVPTPVQREGEIHDDDVFIVRLASNSKTDLVSSDLRLKRQLEKTEILAKGGFRFLEPREVYD